MNASRNLPAVHELMVALTSSGATVAHTAAAAGKSDAIQTKVNPTSTHA